jgi:hypothetical protein
VFLIRLGGQDGMKTNVYFGFDKTEYNKGDEVILTFMRDNDEIFNDYPYNITLYPGGGRFEKVFILNQGETKVEKIQLPQNYNFHRINIGIRGENPLYESISFGINMNDVTNTPPKLPEDSPNQLKHIPRKFDKNTSDSLRPGIKPLIIPLNDSGATFQENGKPKSEPNNKDDHGLMLNNQNSLESATMFTGRITYTDVFNNTEIKPVNHWYYLLYEADDSTHLLGDTIAPTAGYPVVGTNGVFNTTLTVNKNYFFIRFFLQRIVIENNNERRVYAAGQLVTSEDSIALYGLPTEIHKKPTGVFVTFHFNYPQSSGDLTPKKYALS